MDDKFFDLMNNIGHTPLVKLERVMEDFHLPFNLYAKLERCNPSGSVKDRAARYIIETALVKGQIKEDSVIVEATSGNMGISLSMIASFLGIKCRIYMPSSASKERIKMMKGYGSEVVLINGAMKDAVEEAEEFVKNNSHAFYVDQFNNPGSVEAHNIYTGAEILNDLNKVDYFVTGMGTGGTITGVAKHFAKHSPTTFIYGVEPLSSPLLSEGKSGKHLIQGIGPNFVPSILDRHYIERILRVSNEDAYKFTNILSQKEGLLVGISSGANLAAIINNKDLFKSGSNVVIILPDNGERYLSVEGLFND